MPGRYRQQNSSIHAGRYIQPVKKKDETYSFPSFLGGGSYASPEKPQDVMNREKTLQEKTNPSQKPSDYFLSSLWDTAKSGAGSFLNMMSESEQNASKQISGAISSVSPDYTNAVKSQSQLDTMNTKLAKMIGENKRKGKATSRLQRQLNSNQKGRFDPSTIIPDLKRTPLQEAADWGGVGLDTLMAGLGSEVVKPLNKLGGLAVKDLAKNAAKKLGRKALLEATALGSGYGLTNYLQTKKKPTLGRALLQAGIGGLGAAAFVKGGQLLSDASSKIQEKLVGRYTRLESEANNLTDKSVNEALTKPLEDSKVNKSSIPSTIDQTEQKGAVLADKQAVKELPLMNEQASNLPEQLFPEKKRSRFAANLSENAKTSEEVAKGLKEEPLFYDVQHNPETKKRAEEFVKKSPTKAEAFVFDNSAPSADKTATAISLIKKYQSEGDHLRAIQVADEASKNLTQAGQAIQAAKIVENLSPESVLIKAKRFIAKANEKTSIFGKKMALTPDDAQTLYKAAVKMRDATGEAKTELANEVKAILAEYQHVSFGKKVSSIQTQAQLLNPKTQVRNIFGNELFYRMERLTKLLAIPIDIVRSKLSGTERTIIFKRGEKNYWKNFLRGAETGWKGVQLGPDTKFSLPNRTFKNKKNPFYWGEKAVGASLKSFDYAAYSRARDDVLFEFGYLRAKSEGFRGKALRELARKYAKNAEPKIQEIADQYGKYVTFQDDNVISKLAIGLKKGMNLGKDFGIGDLVLKYPKTPGALLSRALEYSPIGFLKSAFEIARPVFLKRIATTAERKEFSMTIARAITGSLGLTGLGYYFAEKGFITGQRSNDKDVNSLNEHTGRKPYQINLPAITRWVKSGFKNDKVKDGDKLFTYDWAQPVGVSIAVGANLNLKGDSSTGETVLDQLTAGTSTYTDQSLLSGLNNFFKSRSLQSGISKMTQGALSSFTPTLSNQFRQYFDNSKRDVNGKTWGSTALNLSKNRIPGIEKQLPLRYDAEGKQIKYFENPNIFNIFLNPGAITTLRKDQNTDLVLNLVSSTGETKQLPRVLGRTITMFGEKYRLASGDYQALQKYSGERTMRGLNNLVENENFNLLTDQEKVKVISSDLSRVGANVKALMMAKELMKMKQEDNSEGIKKITEQMKPGELLLVQQGINYLKEHPSFFPKEKKEEKLDSAAFLKKVQGSGLILGGLGLAAVTHGKEDELFLKGISKVLGKDVTKKIDSNISNDAEKTFIEKNGIKNFLNIFTKKKALEEKVFEEKGVGIISPRVFTQGKNTRAMSNDIISSLENSKDLLPVMVREDGKVYDGQHRLQAALKTKKSQLPFFNLEKFDLPKLKYNSSLNSIDGVFEKNGYKWEWSLETKKTIPEKDLNTVINKWRQEDVKKATPRFFMKPYERIIPDSEKETMNVLGKDIKVQVREKNTKFEQWNEDEVAQPMPLSKIKKNEAIFIKGTEGVDDQASHVYAVLEVKDNGFVAVNSEQYGRVTGKMFDEVSPKRALSDPKVNVVFFPMRRNAKKTFIKKTPNIFGVHSTTEDALKSIVKEGKIHAPSIAIFDKTKSKTIPTREFGHYHLLFKKKILNPTSKDVLFYSDDAYTPRLITNENSAKKLSKDFQAGIDLKGKEVKGERPVQAALATRIKSFTELLSKTKNLDTAENAFKSHFEAFSKIKKEVVSTFPKFSKEILNSNDEENLTKTFLSRLSETKSLGSVEKANKEYEALYGSKLKHDEMQHLLDSINNQMNTMKVMYMEAKPLKSIDLKNGVDTILAPFITDPILEKKIKNLGINVLKYDSNSQIPSLLDKANKLAAMSIMIMPLPLVLPTKTSKTPHESIQQKSLPVKKTNYIIKNSPLLNDKDPVVRRLAHFTKGEGTYYNPKDEKQTRKKTDGTGAYGRKIQLGSVAFGNRYFQRELKEGKKIYVFIKEMKSVKTPYGYGIFRIDDTMSKRYNRKGHFNIDFNENEKIPSALRTKGRFPLTFKIVKIEDR